MLRVSLLAFASSLIIGETVSKRRPHFPQTSSRCHHPVTSAALCTQKTLLIAHPTVQGSLPGRPWHCQHVVGFSCGVSITELSSEPLHLNASVPEGAAEKQNPRAAIISPIGEIETALDTFCSLGYGPPSFGSAIAFHAILVVFRS